MRLSRDNSHKLCAVNVASDLELRPFDLKSVPVTRVQGYIFMKFEVLTHTALRFQVNRRHGTDGWTDTQIDRRT